MNIVHHQEDKGQELSLGDNADAACPCGVRMCKHWRDAQTERLRREINWARAALTVDGQPIALSRSDVEHVLRYIDSALAIATRLAR